VHAVLLRYRFTVQVANRGDLEERVRALEMDRDILLRVSLRSVQLCIQTAVS